MWFDISIFIFLKFILGVTMLSGKIVDVSNQDENYWNSICGDNYIGKIVTGYNTTKEGSIVSIGTSGYTIQIFKSYNSSKTEIRNYYIDTLAWNDWCEIALDYPSFYKNYSSINSLIDAVNPFRTINMLGETDSWDNLTNGVYCFANNHLGADVSFGFMIQYGYQSDRVAQFAVGARGIAKRYNIGNGWKEWSYSRF